MTDNSTAEKLLAQDQMECECVKYKVHPGFILRTCVERVKTWKREWSETEPKAEESKNDPDEN